MNDLKAEVELDESCGIVQTGGIANIHTFECASLSGRSTLTCSIGRDGKSKALYLAITGNSGNGMWCKDWASATAIQGVVLGQAELTAGSFNALHLGKSINTGGFYLAALKELGLVRANAENTRLHEHVPSTSFQAVVEKRLREGDAPVVPGAGVEPSKPSRRKSKGV